MEKPINLIYEETRNKLESIISDSGLPPFILELMLRQLLDTVIYYKNVQYEMDLKKYKEANDGTV